MIRATAFTVLLAVYIAAAVGLAALIVLRVGQAVPLP